MRLDNLFIIPHCLSHPLLTFHQWNLTLAEFWGWAVQSLGHTTLHFSPHNEVAANMKQEKRECSSDTALPSHSEDQKLLWRANSKHPQLFQLFSKMQGDQCCMRATTVRWKVIYLWVSRTSHLLMCCNSAGTGVKQPCSGRRVSWPKDRKASCTGCIPTTASDSHRLTLPFIKARVKWG